MPDQTRIDLSMLLDNWNKGEIKLDVSWTCHRTKNYSPRVRFYNPRRDYTNKWLRQQILEISVTALIKQTTVQVTVSFRVWGSSSVSTIGNWNRHWLLKKHPKKATDWRFENFTHSRSDIGLDEKWEISYVTFVCTTRWSDKAFVDVLGESKLIFDVAYEEVTTPQSHCFSIWKTSLIVWNRA